MNNLEKRKLKNKVLKIIKILKKLFPNPKIALNYSNPWGLFVAVVLSAQCTDKKVNEVTEKLFKKYKKLDDYVKADLIEFQNDIRSIGLYKSKAKNILSSAKIIKEKFNGQIPKKMDEILTLPGIGRKSANVILGNIYGIVDGIAVDTHVKRLSRLLGLTKNTNPDKIEKDLMEIVPKQYWFKITYWLIDYGRKYCPARPHDHKKCPLVKFYI